MIPPLLRDKAVVVVNEYPARGPLPSGHINLTFFFHGVDQGTYGRNSQGLDIAGRKHPQGGFDLKGGPALKMSGGVFKEPNANAMSHYVIVSDKNYKSMYTFAISQAQLTLQNKVDYEFLHANCADFAYQVFAHSDLPQKYRRIGQYLRNQIEPVAIYTQDDSTKYEDGLKNHRVIAEGIAGLRIYGHLVPTL